MPTTPTLKLPYPAATDPADVPLDMLELADRLELVYPLAFFAVRFNNTAVIAAGTPGVTVTRTAAGAFTVTAPAGVVVAVAVATLGGGPVTGTWTVYCDVSPSSNAFTIRSFAGSTQSDPTNCNVIFVGTRP